MRAVRSKGLAGIPVPLTTRPSHPPLMTRSGFTLVEVLAVVAVVTVLIAMSLPALFRARQSADTISCCTRLASIMQTHAAASASHDGAWANALPPGVNEVVWRFPGISYSASTTFFQAFVWPGPLQTRGAFDPDENQEAFSCPVIHRQWRAGTREVHDIAQRSYLYSAALVTRADAWDPKYPAVRELPDELRLRSLVRVSDVTYPSLKVAVSERADWHGSETPLDAPGASHLITASSACNAGFADGHVDRVLVARARAALPARWSTLWGQTRVWSIPFSGPPGGYRGRDF